MIQNLVLRIISLLVETLASVITDAAQHIKAEPVDSSNSSNLPIIVLTPGCFTISQQPGENTSNQPRPEDFREKLAVSQEAKRSKRPYDISDGTRRSCLGNKTTSVLLSKKTEEG